MAADGPPLNLDRVVQALPSDFGHIRVSLGTPDVGPSDRTHARGRDARSLNRMTLTAQVQQSVHPLRGGRSERDAWRTEQGWACVRGRARGALRRGLEPRHRRRTLGCQAVAQPPSCHGHGLT
jgi:hypothetical protein